MRLEHINLVVSNIPTSLKFYKAAFPHWQIRCKGKGEWYGKSRNWMHFGDDYQYLVFNDHGIGENRDLKGHQVGLAHFAFATLNLDALIKRMETAGFSVDKYGSDNPYRSRVYFIDPDGFEIEFIQYFSDLPDERNNSL